MAERTGGRYYRATDPEGLSGIMSQIDRLERTDVQVGEIRDFRELYPFFLVPALLLLTLELSLRATWLRSLP
jgi:Ca-activated chloride channel family protein